MSVLLDTNLLTRSLQPDSPHFGSATRAIDLLRQSERLCIVPQNLYELWAVLTRPLGDNGFGADTKSAGRELAKARSIYAFVPDTPEVCIEWERLVLAHDVKGKNTHDARLVAAMNVHGIQQVLTFNHRDFSRYAGIKVINAAAI